MALFRVKKKTKEQIINGVKLGLKGGIVGALVAILTMAIVVIPEVHKDYVLDKARNSTVKIALLNDNRRGGTGFIVSTSKGNRIITNAHVCRALGETGLGAIYLAKEKEARLARVLKISETADLCMMSGFEDVDALTLGSDPNVGDTVMATGHPYLQPATPTIGKVVSKSFAVIQDNPLGCNPKYGSSVIILPFIGCLRAYNVYNTTLTAHPGNSGSPVVNNYGNVVGVIFATSAPSYQGLIVTYPDLKQFLEENNDV